MSNHNTESQTQIFYAGKSLPRANFIKEISGGNVIPVGGGDESKTDHVFAVARVKLDFAKGKLNGTFAHPETKKRKLMVSVDIGTEIPSISPDGKLVFESKGKPKHTREVKANFRKMLVAARRFGHATYRVVSSSFAEESGAQNLMGETIQTSIQLSEKSIVYLCSKAGFEAYLKRFNEVHSISPHGSDQLKKTTVRNISGGISLSVLISMGLVESIDGVHLNGDVTEDVDLAVRSALLTVACGFGGNVLEMVKPGALEDALKWDWVQAESQRALSWNNNSTELQ